MLDDIDINNDNRNGTPIPLYGKLLVSESSNDNPSLMYLTEIDNSAPNDECMYHPWAVLLELMLKLVANLDPTITRLPIDMVSLLSISADSMI